LILGIYSKFFFINGFLGPTGGGVLSLLGVSFGWKIKYIGGASKIKLKNVNKKMATARRQIFLEFLNASIADLITLLFSSLQTSEGCGDSDSSDSCAEPCQFLPFQKTKL
jgi:hypothetical protein